MDDHGKDHDQAQLLLPWFVNGQLDADERAQVADHLAQCAACRHDVEVERTLRAGIIQQPIDLDLGWARLKERVTAVPPPHRSWRRARRLLPRRLAAPRVAGAIIALQAAVLAAVLLWVPPSAPPGRYHALGSADAAPAGNMIVMFRADLHAADIARILDADGVRIVDGPTDAGAFVLAVPPARRPTALAHLRAQAGLTMAEPIDP